VQAHDLTVATLDQPDFAPAGVRLADPTVTVTSRRVYDASMMVPVYRPAHIVGISKTAYALATPRSLD
jgi:hypothetical protein